MRWPKQIFVTGTDTGLGKTLISAMLVAGLKAPYWKPVQAGKLPQTDSEWIQSHCTDAIIHPERYVLETPASPHLAAKIDNVHISLDDFELPVADDSPLIVEGAGGLLVPLNEKDLIIDLISRLDIPVVLVARSSLGTINHTLLSIEALHSRGINLFGVIMNGSEHDENRRAIEHYGKTKVLGRVPDLEQMDEDKLVEIFTTRF